MPSWILMETPAMPWVLFLGSYILVYLMGYFMLHKYLSEDIFIETILSTMPALILMELVIPSMWPHIIPLLESLRLCFTFTTHHDFDLILHFCIHSF